MQAGPCTVTIAWASPSLSLLAFPGGEPTWVPSWSSTTSAPEAAASDRSEEPSSARVKSSKPAAALSRPNSFGDPHRRTSPRRGVRSPPEVRGMRQHHHRGLRSARALPQTLALHHGHHPWLHSWHWPRHSGRGQSYAHETTLVDRGSERTAPHRPLAWCSSQASARTKRNSDAHPWDACCLLPKGES